MNDLVIRAHLRQALDEIDAAAAEFQHELNQRAALGCRPGEAGRLIALGCRCEQLNRIAGELHRLLDQPPPLAGAGSIRLLPRPERSDDTAA